MGYGLKQYFKEYFNTFDCIIVLISCIDVALQLTIQSSGNSAISALRAFRLLRVFKLAKNWQKFQELLRTIGNTLHDISIFSILLFLFLFIYTLLGLELFAFTCAKNADDAVDFVNGAPPVSNFNSFRDSFITVFILLTGDGWTSIMFDYYRCDGAGLAVFFCLSFLIVGQFILLNLFLAILLQNFEEDSIDQELQKKQIMQKKI